jgi:hypothetical protein
MYVFGQKVLGYILGDFLPTLLVTLPALCRRKRLRLQLSRKVRREHFFLT